MAHHNTAVLPLVPPATMHAGVWSAVMSRKLKPCDLAGDLEIVPGQQITMLWAHGSVAQNSFSGVTYHGPGFENKGSIGVTLLAEEVLTQGSALEAADAAVATASAAPEPLPVTDAHVVTASAAPEPLPVSDA